MRNIRHKNEQVYLAPIPRGFDIYRVSLAAKMSGLDLPARRDIKLIPYALGSVNKDYTRAAAISVDENGDVGVDLKWGIRPNLTLDATYNTDFAQVEADEEQVNLTRFDLFFPEKRPFFLENASTFQFGNPQQIDLFFSRRIGLSPTALPIDIRGGGRLSGKLGGWNVGAAEHPGRRCRGLPAATTSARRTTSASCACSARSAARATAPSSSTARASASTRSTRTGTAPTASTPTSRSTQNQRVSAFLARTDTPDDRPTGPKGSDYSGRAFYNFTNNLWQISGGYSQVGENFNPEVGFLPRRGYRRPEFRAFFQPQPKNIEWIRRVAPHISYNSFWGFDERAADRDLAHPPVRDSAEAGRPLRLVLRLQQGQPDGAVRGLQPRRPPRGDSGRPVRVGPERVRVPAQPQCARHRHDPLLASATTTTATSTASS